jgi:phosphoglycolate phosphatase-like HAD superfamily hydrolase
MKLLIFDIDGTLTDTKAVDDDCFISAFLDEYKIELKNIDWSNFKNVTDYGLFIDIFNSSFNRNPTEADRLNFQRRFFEYLDNQLKSNPEKFKSVNGASSFIKYCLEHTNFKIAFATGGWHYSANLKLKAADIFNVGIPISSCDILFRRQDILLEAIEKSKHHYKTQTFDKIIYFGDGVWDYKTTCELEIEFIGVDITGDKKLEKLGVENILKDFADIVKVLSTVAKTTSVSPKTLVRKITRLKTVIKYDKRNTH